MVGHSAVDAGLEAVCVARRRSEDAFEGEELVFFSRDVVTDRQIVTAAEVPVAFASYHDGSYGAILPRVAPSVSEFERVSFVDDVRSASIGEGDSGDVTVGLVSDAHFLDRARWIFSLSAT